MAMNLPSSGRGRGARRAPMAEINVTPFVDVMLVLLIIFMVTAPLLVTGVPVNLPESRAGALDQDRKPIQVSIDQDGRIFLDDVEVREAELADRFAALAPPRDAAAKEGTAAGKGPPQVYLRADRGLDYGRVIRVMGELNRAGLNRVSLVTTDSEGR